MIEGRRSGSREVRDEDGGWECRMIIMCDERLEWGWRREVRNGDKGAATRWR